MSGLAEILDENTRLRQALATAEQGRQEAERSRQEAEQALTVRGEELAAATKRADELAQELWLSRQSHISPASQRYVPPEQTAFPMFAEAPAPPREGVNRGCAPWRAELRRPAPAQPTRAVTG